MPVAADSTAQMQIHELNVQEALASLKSSWDGLKSTEATPRLQEYGPNEIAQARQCIENDEHDKAVLQLWNRMQLGAITK
jgi:hypothetical protein